MKPIGFIRYDNEANHWVFLNHGDYYPLHCGDAIDIFLLNRYRTWSLELDNHKDWYIIFNDVSFNLRKNKVYKVKF